MKLIKLQNRFIIPNENLILNKDDVLTHVSDKCVYSFVKYNGQMLITTNNTEIGICESWIASNLFCFKEQMFASTNKTDSDQLIVFHDLENAFINAFIDKGFTYSKAKLKANMLLSYTNSAFTKDELFMFYTEGSIADKSINLKSSFSDFYELRFKTEWNVEITYNPLLKDSLKVIKIHL